jgi:hypothetical protein
MLTALHKSLHNVILCLILKLVSFCLVEKGGVVAECHNFGGFTGRCCVPLNLKPREGMN